MLHFLTDTMSPIIPAGGPKPDSPRIGCKCGSLLAMTMCDGLRSAANWMLCVVPSPGRERRLRMLRFLDRRTSTISPAQPPPWPLPDVEKGAPMQVSLFCNMHNDLHTCTADGVQHLSSPGIYASLQRPGRLFMAHMAPPAVAKTSKFGLASARHPHPFLLRRQVAIHCSPESIHITLPCSKQQVSSTPDLYLMVAEGAME